MDKNERKQTLAAYRNLPPKIKNGILSSALESALEKLPASERDVVKRQAAKLRGKLNVIRYGGEYANNGGASMFGESQALELYMAITAWMCENDPEWSMVSDKF